MSRGGGREPPPLQCRGATCAVLGLACGAGPRAFRAEASRRFAMPYIERMDVVTGTDTSALLRRRDRLLAGIRRLTALADEASRRGDGPARARARAAGGAGRRGGARPPPRPRGRATKSWSPCTCSTATGASATCCRAPSARPGVSWVASTQRSFLAADAAEFAASVPRLTETGAVELRAAAAARRARRGRGRGRARAARRRRSFAPRGGRARDRARRAGGDGARAAAARAPRRAPTRSPAA